MIELAVLLDSPPRSRRSTASVAPLRLRTSLLILAAASMAACAARHPPVVTNPPPPVAAPAPAPPRPVAAHAAAAASPTEGGRALATRVGLASFYGGEFEGRLTASGVPFDKDWLWAAHPRWAFGTRVRVTNLDNGKSVVVRIVDRGPADEYVAQGVIIDLAREAAARLGFLKDGRQEVRLDVLEWGRPGGASAKR